MELNINSPAYFKEHYGIDDEVYKFCQKAYIFFKDKEYSNTYRGTGDREQGSSYYFYFIGISICVI